MFVVRLTHDTQLALQAEQIADARWFSEQDALEAFPVANQREVFEACLKAIAA